MSLQADHGAQSLAQNDLSSRELQQATQVCLFTNNPRGSLRVLFAYFTTSKCVVIGQLSLTPDSLLFGRVSTHL